MTKQSPLLSLPGRAGPFHPNAPDILFRHGKTRSTSVTFAHLANHQRQRAVDDLGEGARPVEEARCRPDSGTEEDARVVDEEKPIPPPGNIRGESVVPLIEGRNKRIMAFYRG